MVIPTSVISYVQKFLLFIIHCEGVYFCLHIMLNAGQSTKPQLNAKFVVYI